MKRKLAQIATNEHKWFYTYLLSNDSERHYFICNPPLYAPHNAAPSPCWILFWSVILLVTSIKRDVRNGSQESTVRTTVPLVLLRMSTASAWVTPSRQCPFTAMIWSPLFSLPSSMAAPYKSQGGVTHQHEPIWDHKLLKACHKKTVCILVRSNHLRKFSNNLPTCNKVSSQMGQKYNKLVNAIKLSIMQ